LTNFWASAFLFVFALATAKFVNVHSTIDIEHQVRESDIYRLMTQCYGRCGSPLGHTIIRPQAQLAKELQTCTCVLSKIMG
jgi:hypothetical protein